MTAKVKGAKPIGPRVAKGATDVAVVNFVEDGFTAFGNVWYRGQTCSVERGTEDWGLTLDEEGKSWMEYDEDTQIYHYGRRMFRAGTWAGGAYDLDEPHLSDEDRETLERIAAAEAEPPRAPATRGSRRRADRPPLP